MQLSGWWTAAGLSGAALVIMGAFGSHALKDVLDERGHQLWRTAVLYQGIHLAPLLALGLLPGGDWRASAAGWAFCAGTLLFSGSLYAMALGAPRGLGAVTPLGGLAFIAGWAFLIALRT